MKELEKVIGDIEEIDKRMEQMGKKRKLLNQKKTQIQRKAETKRKIEKGGVFEAFERQITAGQEITNKNLVYDFLDYVLSDNRNREKLKQLTENHLKQQELDIEETENPDNENDDAGSKEIKKADEEMQNNLSESED
ncbi:MAG: hypothetical protein ACTTJ3_04010 [Treponema sp.]